MFDPRRTIAEVMAAFGVRRGRNEKRIQREIGRRAGSPVSANALPESDRLVPKTTIPSADCAEAHRGAARRTTRQPDERPSDEQRRIAFSKGHECVLAGVGSRGVGGSRRLLHDDAAPLAATVEARCQACPDEDLKTS